jgi:hypothetical protein
MAGGSSVALHSARKGGGRWVESGHSVKDVLVE